MRKTSGTLIAIAVAALASLAVLAPQHSIAAGSSSSVSFSAAQVSAGSKAFQQNCSTCHGTNLEGGAGPALSGPNFQTLNNKVHAKVGDIFTYMTTNMPLNAPASLTHDQYTTIMAFILSKNGYHPGGSPLTYSSALNSKAPITK
jgi:mono/diheme cytochrome c family protein